MEQTELTRIEESLEQNGYKKYLTCLSSNESWGWFKSFKQTNENGEEELMFQIEYRVWDWRKYEGRTPEPYGMDVLILINCVGRIDLELSDIKDIEKIESTANDFYKFCFERNLINWTEDGKEI